MKNNFCVKTLEIKDKVIKEYNQTKIEDHLRRIEYCQSQITWLSEHLGHMSEFEFIRLIFFQHRFCPYCGCTDLFSYTRSVQVDRMEFEDKSHLRCEQCKKYSYKEYEVRKNE